MGPKGQVVILKQKRDALGQKPGIQVVLELRGNEIVITKPKIEGNYTEYYTSTQASKLKKPRSNQRELSLKRLTEDLAYIDSNAFFDVSFLITFGESLLNN